MEAFTKEEFILLGNLITDYSGIELESNKSDSILRAVKERALKTGFRNLLEYLRYVKHTAGATELDNLIDSVTNSETYFFRLPEHFEILKKVVLPQIVDNKNLSDKTLRIWSAGCSSGEEAYSLAIIIFQCLELLSGFEIDIIGTDINRNALKVAGEGVYKSNSFRSNDSNWLNTYFEPIGGKYRINHRIRRMVNFQYLNLYKGDYPNQIIKDADIIFFRNVSIYYKYETIKRINAKLSNCLTNGGYLFLAPAETLHHNVGNFSLVEIDGTFLFQKRNEEKSVQQKFLGPDRVESIVLQNSGGISLPGNGLAENKVHLAQDADPQIDVDTELDIKLEYERALKHYKDKDYEEALAKFKGILQVQPQNIKAHIFVANIYLNGRKLNEALQACERALVIDPWSADVCLTLGIISRHQDDYDKAIEQFKRTVYIKPDNWLAHFFLGDIYRKIERNSEAIREYRSSIKAIEKRNDDMLFPFTVEYSPQSLIGACRKNIDRLEVLVSEN